VLLIKLFELIGIIHHTLVSKLHESIIIVRKNVVHVAKKIALNYNSTKKGYAYNQQNRMEEL